MVVVAVILAIVVDVVVVLVVVAFPSGGTNLAFGKRISSCRRMYGSRKISPGLWGSEWN